ncbi:hypothetical protein H9Y04_08595 [Streptomyces sp. TRM66268-LWL]|uniref:DUF3558 domain-containing protein n=1 Tax=Streptomyces polyasparticus TaxID=2767826 RepID=A0ABR7SDT5_9ACTN|nr:hypothetical protein [Streptomyces polyasparticus]MBC9712631.1 hypothetical protein [Streptomyces polyasparticus]
MRSLPLLLAGRLLPVVVLATAGWAWTSGPYAPDDIKPAAAPRSTPTPTPEAKHDKPPEPCGAVDAAVVKKLVPGAKPAGKEIELTDPDRRRTCSWSALKNFDYRWLDVSYEVFDSQKAAEAAYKKYGDKGGQPLRDLGDAATILVSLTTKDKQQTREAVVTARSGNALMTITYNGCDFESRKAPTEASIQEGAETAARAALQQLTAQA